MIRRELINEIKGSKNFIRAITCSGISIASSHKSSILNTNIRTISS